MRVGDYAQRCEPIQHLVGTPLSPRSKEAYLGALRQFFRDVQEWGWIPRRFDPTRALATPRSVKALIGPAPRVIADDVWAKLLWAGLHLEPSRSRAQRPGRPLLSRRARARPGGDVALQRPPQPTRSPGSAPAASAGKHRPTRPRTRCVCSTSRPTRRGRPSRSPSIRSSAARSRRGKRSGPCSRCCWIRGPGNASPLLFCLRAKRVAREYINHALIPALCRKAGVPRDGRAGPHHEPSRPLHDREPTLQRQGADDPVRAAGLARSSLAAVDPALHADHADPLGAGVRRRRLLRAQPPDHRRADRSRGRPERRGGERARRGSTSISAMGTARTTSSSSARTGWRARDATSIVPKASTRAQLLEAKASLQRMLLTIPLTEDERAAVDDGADAVERLLARLADTPTPAGPTPRADPAAARPAPQPSNRSADPKEVDTVIPQNHDQPRLRRLVELSRQQAHGHRPAQPPAPPVHHDPHRRPVPTRTARLIAAARLAAPRTTTASPESAEAPSRRRPSGPLLMRSGG